MPQLVHGRYFAGLAAMLVGTAVMLLTVAACCAPPPASGPIRVHVVCTLTGATDSCTSAP